MPKPPYQEDKLPFYPRIGVLEVWIIDRDSKEIDLYLRSADSFARQPVGENGWFRSPFTGIELRAGRPGKFAIRMGTDDSTREELPED